MKMMLKILLTIGLLAFLIQGFRNLKDWISEEDWGVVVAVIAMSLIVGTGIAGIWWWL